VTKRTALAAAPAAEIVPLVVAARDGAADAFRELHRRFATDTVETSADACVAALDRWLGRPLFSETCGRHLAGQGVADMTALLRDLGVVVEDGRVRLDDAAPLASVRRVIANE